MISTIENVRTGKKITLAEQAEALDCQIDIVKAKIAKGTAYYASINHINHLKNKLSKLAAEKKMLLTPPML